MNLDKIKRKLEISQGLRIKIKSFLSSDYLKNPIVIWLLALSLFFNLINWIALAIFLKPVDFPIIIHYNVYFGVDVQGNWKEAYLLPVIGLVVYIFNLFFSIFFYRKMERIATYVLLIGTLMIQLSFNIAVASILIINY